MLLLPIFCLRLACGLSGVLLLVAPAQVNPRFYRIQFLTVLGLVAAAALCLRGVGDLGFWLTLAATMVLAFLAALAGSLEGAPAGRTLGLLTVCGAVAALCLARSSVAPDPGFAWLLAAELSSAALLGTATTAMLMGHSYLLAPSMSLTPLLRLLGAFFIALVLRVVICGIGLWSWVGDHSLAAADELTLFVPVRWGIGFVAPGILGIMAWQTARIRSTQSATGILYAAVILTFLGELVSQVLLRDDLLYS